MDNLIFFSPLTLKIIANQTNESHEFFSLNSGFAQFPLSPKVRFLARSGPPFVIRSVLVGWGCPGLQMVDLSEQENGLWGRERGDRANRIRDTINEDTVCEI